MDHNSSGYTPLDDLWDNRYFGYRVSSMGNFRSSRTSLIISLALLIIKLVSYAVLFLFFPDLVYQDQSLPSGAYQSTGVASPAPTATPSDLMLQDPRYWRTVNVACHPGGAIVIEQ